MGEPESGDLGIHGLAVWVSCGRGGGSGGGAEACQRLGFGDEQG